MTQFTAEQIAAINHPLRPLLIVAGAGSGKTTVMAARITAAAEHVDQRHILGLTFSNKAAAHLRGAVVKHLGADSDVIISTYHGFGASLVSRYGHLIGWPKHLRLLDHAQSLQLLYDIFETTSYVHRKTGAPLGILRDALALSGRLSDHLVSIDALERDCAAIMNDLAADINVASAAGKRVELVPLIREYRTKKQTLGLLDHDDQIALAYEIVSTHTEVAERLRSQHQVVLLDEYQDTNFAQRCLLQAIYGEHATPAVTAVGDDMQSIYAFRGAHLANLHGFVQHFDKENPSGRPLVLSTSFRNDQNILELANRIQSKVKGAQPKTLVAHDNAKPGSLQRVLSADSWDEANEIARHIQRLIAHGVAPSEIAVLCRKRRLIGPVVEALDASAIAAEVVGLGGLLVRPEVIELRCWLEIIANTNEFATAIPLLRLLRGPRYRVGLHDLAALATSTPRTPPRTSPSESLDAPERQPEGIEAGLNALAERDLSPEAVGRLTRFVEERNVLRVAAAELPLVELMETILTYTGLWQAVDGDLPAENLSRFLHVGERFQPLQGGRGLQEFLNWLTVMEDSETDLSEAVQSGADAVQVMTIHQAKGLEFDHVIIPGLSGSKTSQLFPDTSRTDFPPTQGAGLPHWLRTDNDGQTKPSRLKKELDAARAAAKQRQLDEEWRLFYVAVTRARHGVLFTAAHWYGDTQSAQGPSEFFTWISDQTDLVTPVAPDAPSADEAPGLAERRRRQESAAIQRQADAEAALAASKLAARTAAKPGKKRRTADQLGFAFAAGDTPATMLSAPKALPVSAFVLLARCPRQFHWTHIRPMPRQASAASVLGTRVHSWIEAHGGRLRLNESQPSLFSDDVLVRTHTSQVASERAFNPLSGYQESFLASVYGPIAPTHVELPILIDADGLLVRGRIDAVYPGPVSDPSHVRVVDFKTGNLPLSDDPGPAVQLDLYGLATQRLLKRPAAQPSDMSTSGLYLQRNGAVPIEFKQPWSAERAAVVESNLRAAVATIRSGDQQPHPGSWCQRCVYADLCPDAQTSAKADLEPDDPIDVDDT
jgi:DNA helicase II / ATP-dependent DNA helicase PcrA